MRLKNGDRVKHPALPAWGIGQVLGDPVDNTVRVFFVGVGEKVIALDRVSLMPVTGTEAHEALLDNLRRSDSGAVIRYRSLPESIAYFLGQYPGGFYGQTFMKQERNYKVAAHELCSDLLSKTKLKQLLSSRDCDEAIREALRVVNATNLIFPNEKMSFRDGLADLATRTRFAEALYDLLHGVGVLEQRFLGFIRVLEAIGAAKWTICELLPLPLRPQRLRLSETNSDAARGGGLRLRDQLQIGTELENVRAGSGFCALPRGCDSRAQAARHDRYPIIHVVYRARVRSNYAVQQTGARVARSGC